MLVKALSSFCIGGGVDVKAGQEFEAESYNARRWIALGFVVAVEAAPAAAPTPARQSFTAAEVIETREPAPEHREPRARRKE